MKNTLGYTLAELMIVLAIILITISVAAPVLGRMIRDNEKTQSVNQMLNLLGYTRSSAVFTRADTTICTGVNNCTGSKRWEGQLLVFSDTNSNGRLDDPEVILRHETLPEHYSWYWSSFRNLDHVIFEADGTSRATNGTMTLCYAGQPIHQIVISLAGRARHQPPSESARCQ